MSFSNKRAIFQGLALATLLVAMLGCGGKEVSPAQDTAQPTESKSDDTLQIAVVPKGLAHQFWLTVKAGAEAAAKENNAEIIWQGPAKETEVDKQINIIQDMISRKVDGIVMAACNENALIQIVEKAHKNGIPVVTIDSGIKSDIQHSFVATDNMHGAKMAADALADMIGGEGKVGLIPFVKGAATSELREQGFREGIAAYPGITLVATLYCDSDVAKAMNVTQDMLTANPDLKGIFATNEPAAIGAAQAIKAAGKTGQVKLVAFDAAEEEINGLKNGSIQALVVQDPYKMGYVGVESVITVINGGSIEKRIDTGVTIVTLENFEEPEVQKLLYPLE